MARQVYYFDMDGVIANFHKEPYNFKNAASREWIANLEPFMHNIDILKGLLANNKSVYIITKAATKEARDGKIDWLNKHIPEFNIKRFICIIGYGKKPDYMRTKTGLLIDDDIKNCKQWEKAGNKYIHLEAKGQLIDLGAR